MPPRRRSGAAASTPDHLTADNLAALATAVAEGKRATVYLREATPSLGIEAGTSAKVVSVDGNTVMIRPKGVNDELPFEAEELRINRVSAAPAKPAPRPKPVVESEPLMEPLVEPVRPKPRAQPAPAPVPTTTAALPRHLVRPSSVRRNCRPASASPSMRARTTTGA